jgi:signal transduction histidine kinase
MRICILIAVMCWLGSAVAQNTETDSLKKLLVVTEDERKRVGILEGLSYAFLSSYPDTALQYALEGLELAKKIKFRKGEAICLNALGNVYFHTGDNVKALQLYHDYLRIKEELNEKENLAVAYFNIASVYTEEKDFPHALNYLFKAKQEDERYRDSAGILFDLYSLGSIYLRMQNPDSALHNLQQSYQYARKLDDRNMLGAIYNNFGEVYLFKNDYALADKYYKLSIPYAAAVKDNEVLTSSYFGLARIFQKKNMVDSAIYYGRKALLLAREAPFLRQVLETSTFLTDLFSGAKKYDSAFIYQQISITTKDSLVNLEQVKKVQKLKFEEQQRQQAMEASNLQYINRVRLLIVLLISVFLLLVAAVLWRNNKQKQKANIQLQQQKEKLEITLAELKQTQAQLIHSEKMASLGQLTAGIAHEIQNPLNFVNNFSELNDELIEEMKEATDVTEMKEIVKDIQQNNEKISLHGKRAESIVKGMLQHSRTSTGQKEATDINALADEYLRLSYHGLRAKDKTFHADMINDFDTTIGKMNIVPQDIGRVLLNLYNNAFYAVTQKSKTAGGNYQPTVSVRTSNLNGKVEIRIKDNGVGIPQKELNKIFQPFFTTKPTGQGTGLGLSLAYDIVKAHGGDLKVATTEGEGAEFILQLPRSVS